MENRLNAADREFGFSNHDGLKFEYIHQHVRLSSVVPFESTSRQELERGLKTKYPEDDVQTALTDYEIQNGELPPSFDIFEDFLKNSKGKLVDLKEKKKQLDLELRATKERLKEEMFKNQSYQLGQNQKDIPFALQEPRQNFAQNHKYLFVLFMILMVVVLLTFMYFF